MLLLCCCSAFVVSAISGAFLVAYYIAMSAFFSSLYSSRLVSLSSPLKLTQEARTAIETSAEPLQATFADLLTTCRWAQALMVAGAIISLICIGFALMHNRHLIAFGAVVSLVGPPSRSTAVN